NVPIASRLYRPEKTGIVPIVTRCRESQGICRISASIASKCWPLLFVSIVTRSLSSKPGFKPGL
ncbi:MAG: hypothetical protein DRH34_12160, partial [Deltaproteobacteria bacterium]